MSKKLSKSPEMLRREAAIRKLQTDLKKKQSTLKRLKTRLQNMKADIEDIQHKFHGQVLRQMEKMDQLREEIAGLADRLKKVKWLGKDDKAALQAIATEFGSGSLFGEAFEDFQEQKARREAGDFDFEEEERAKMQDLFQQFQVPPADEEQRDIRKVFLKLSNKFHPDKAGNEKEAATFHAMMQDINQAYQQCDVQSLLEMERLYLIEELDFEHKALTADLLQKEIDRLQKEMYLIENQIERTSEEIKNLRQSDLGNMLTAFNRAEREGEGVDEMTSSQEHMVELLTRIRDGMQESLSMQTLSPTLDEAFGEMMDGFSSPEEIEWTDEDIMGMVMEMMEDEGGEFSDLFAGFEVENPKFPIGSSVRVIHSVPSPISHKVKMKNWEGRVEDVFYDERDRVTYEISFDSATIDQMPAKLIEKAIREGEDFQTCELLEPALIVAQARDTEAEAFVAYRKRFHSLAWIHLSQKQNQRLQEIMLKYPSSSDVENWRIYLTENLSLPFEAETRKRLGMPAGIAMKVVDIDFEAYDDDYGYIATVKVPKQRGRFNQPLFSIKSKDRTGKNRQILEDYYAWAQEWLML